MILRLLCVAFTVIWLTARAQAAETPLLPVAPGHSPTLLIYLAKGPPDACGPGCDRWIAVEGRVDPEAAPRVGAFLRGITDPGLPFYFHSPGGEVRQAFAIGRLLRARKAIGRVGQTVVDGCAGAQIDADCLKIKSGGDEVAAHIVTRNAICHSACSYLLFGAVTREVPLDAAMAVHSVKVSPMFRVQHTEQQREQFIDRAARQEDRVQATYIEAMGISNELSDLLDTVPFEAPHVLTRQELFRFDIDPRSQVETDWSFEPSTHPFIRKRALIKNVDGPAFRVMEWRLYCDGRDRVRLIFMREFKEDTSGVSAVTLMAGAEKPLNFFTHPARVGPFEVWTAAMADADVEQLSSAPRLQIAETSVTSDDKDIQFRFDIDTRHLAADWAQLHASCAAIPGLIANKMASPVQPTAPASVPAPPVPAAAPAVESSGVAPR